MCGNDNYSKMGTFRFWCQKTLPLVYDDSLSYYELLCKVVNYINGLINDVNYLKNYFDNLDVSGEIEKVLDKYAEDGTLDNIINNNIFGELNTKVNKNADDIQQNKEDIEELNKDVSDVYTNIYSSCNIGEATSRYSKTPRTLIANWYSKRGETNANDVVIGGWVTTRPMHLILINEIFNATLELCNNTSVEYENQSPRDSELLRWLQQNDFDIFNLPTEETNGFNFPLGTDCGYFTRICCEYAIRKMVDSLITDINVRPLYYNAVSTILDDIINSGDVPRVLTSNFNNYFEQNGLAKLNGFDKLFSNVDVGYTNPIGLQKSDIQTTADNNKQAIQGHCITIMGFAVPSDKGGTGGIVPQLSRYNIFKDTLKSLSEYEDETEIAIIGVHKTPYNSGIYHKSAGLLWRYIRYKLQNAGIYQKWFATSTYRQGEKIITQENNIYVSLQNNNLNHRPADTLGEWWELEV